ncbi:MAG: glycosyltransferase family 2 protein, partial [Candidatus Cardinium sp.]|nr:glycosyltransferase family 2 protein [Candidatus Cardinium sp.]
ACYYLFLGKGNHSWAICKAQIDFLKLRKKCNINRSLLPLRYRYKGNSVFDYFMRGKKRFSDLPDNEW